MDPGSRFAWPERRGWLLMARDPLWNVPETTDRVRHPTRDISLVQISLTRPSRRNHPQALLRPRRNRAGLGPQKRFLFQPQADHARSRRRGAARGTDL